MELNNDTLKQFFTDTAPFSWAFKKDVLNFIKTVTEKGYTPHFAMRCIAVRRQAEIDHVQVMDDMITQWSKKSPKCPKCGGVMRLEPVNSFPGDQVPGSYKSIWFCDNLLGCGHDELSKKSVTEWIKKLGISTKMRMRPYNQYFEIPKEVLDAADIPEDIQFED